MIATTPEDVWRLLGELIQSQKQTDRELQELKQILQRQAEEADRRAQEADRRRQEADQELKQILQRQSEAADRRAQEADRRAQEAAQEADRRRQEAERRRQEATQEAERRRQEADRRSEEADRRLQETDRLVQETQREIKDTQREIKETQREIKKTDRQIKELGKQIGGLGNKIGSFTEGLALPSMQKLLMKEFGMEVVSPSVRVSKHGEHIEIDVLSYCNGDLNTAYLVEVKSHAREESISQLHNLLDRFRTFFPEHHNKTIYGILAAVDISPDLCKKTVESGFYLARIQDEVFKLDVPENFRPKAY